MYTRVQSEEVAGVYQGNKCIPGKGSRLGTGAEDMENKRSAGETKFTGSRLGYFTSEESEAQRDEWTQLRSDNFFCQCKKRYLKEMTFPLNHSQWASRGWHHLILFIFSNSTANNLHFPEHSWYYLETLAIMTTIATQKYFHHSLADSEGYALRRSSVHGQPCFGHESPRQSLHISLAHGKLKCVCSSSFKSSVWPWRSGSTFLPLSFPTCKVILTDLAPATLPPICPEESLGNQEDLYYLWNSWGKGQSIHAFKK